MDTLHITPAFTPESCTGGAENGYVHQLVKHNKGGYSDGKENHINCLEGFRGIK